MFENNIVGNIFLNGFALDERLKLLRDIREHMLADLSYITGLDKKEIYEDYMFLHAYSPIKEVLKKEGKYKERESLVWTVTEYKNWFGIIIDNLRDYPDGDIWTSGNEILVKTESAANAIADMLETMYRIQGSEVLVNTGYYDPEEDEKNGEVDQFTGWWYVNIN